MEKRRVLRISGVFPQNTLFRMEIINFGRKIGHLGEVILDKKFAIIYISKVI
jgi:hypothetical protein